MIQSWSPKAEDLQQAMEKTGFVQHRGKPQPSLSRRERRLASKGARRAERDAVRAAQAPEQPVHAMKTPAIDRLMAVMGHAGVETGIPLDGLTLKDLRGMAQKKGVRVDGKRPSLCTKAELLTALIE